jgi:aspartate aminotransferase-like enzyme
MIIVDAISGAFAHRIDFDALDLDLIVTGSHKGLGVSSGLAYGALSRRAVARMLALGAIDAAVSDWTARPDAAAIVESFEQRQRVRYLSLPRLLLEQAGRLSSDEPPSVFHVLSTLRALDLHDADGGQDAVIARHADMARMVREGLAQAGLRAIAYAPFESDSVTPAFVPEGLTASELRKQLERQYGIAIAGAQGDYWKRQMIRIGHLGFVYPHDVARCLRALAVLYRQAAATADVGA